MEAHEEAGQYVASWQGVPDGGDLKDTWGRWTLEPLGPDTTKVHFIAVVDLGRTVPGLMLRWSERKALPALLDALLAQRTDR